MSKKIFSVPAILHFPVRYLKKCKKMNTGDFEKLRGEARVVALVKRQMGKMAAKECQNVEYKRSWHDKYLEWICGFANAQGAVMYFGVNDNREVVGLEHVDRLMDDIPNKIVTTMGIVADVNLHEQSGREFIEVVVEPSNVPISYKGKFFYRSGSTLQELHGPALQQFVLRKMGHSWDDFTNEFATIDDLDRDAIDYFLRKGIKAGRINEDETEASTQRVLENLSLMGENGKLKNAALLLFAKNPRRFFTCVEFKIGRFRKNEADLVTQDVIEGNIVQMTDRVVDVLKTKYLTSPIHYEGMQRIETLEVPENALREILYNAIAHKDYMGAPIQMRVWDDSIEIWNEGVLPEGYTSETLMEKHSSHPRNKNVAYAFFKAGFIESWGRGYQKIREGFERAGLPVPKVETAEGGVRVTFQRNNQANMQENMTEDIESTLKSTLKSTQKRIVEIIMKNPSVTIPQIAVQLNLNSRGVARHIKTLQENGIIRRVGPDKGGFWVVL